MRVLRWSAAVLLPLALLTGCGTNTGAGSGDWQVEELSGERGVDFPSAFAVDGEDVLVVLFSDDGVLQSHLSRSGERFTAGEPLETGEKAMGLSGAVLLPDGSWFSLGTSSRTKVTGNDGPEYEAPGFVSTDGLHWERIDVGGFTHPADVEALVEVDGGVVAVGTHRTAKRPAMGGFRAAAWRSEDGRRFREVHLPGSDRRSVVGAVVAYGERLLAAGSTGRHGALWSSDDDGRTWSLVRSPLLRRTHYLSALAVVDDTLLASAGEQSTYLLRSTDGRTWERIPAPAGGGEGYTPVWSAAGRFLTYGGGAEESFLAVAAACYADLAQCGRGRETREGIYASEDGDAWTRVDLSGPGEVDRFTSTADGRTVVLAGPGEGVAVAMWPAAADLPVADEPEPPETVALNTLGDKESPEVGVRYHAPFYTHCGIEWLWLGNSTYRRTDAGPDISYGVPEEIDFDVPLAGQMLYGFAELREDGVVYYTTEAGDVIATYERKGGAPGCM